MLNLRCDKDQLSLLLHKFFSNKNDMDYHLAVIKCIKFEKHISSQTLSLGSKDDVYLVLTRYDRVNDIRLEVHRNNFVDQLDVLDEEAAAIFDMLDDLIEDDRVDPLQYIEDGFDILYCDGIMYPYGYNLCPMCGSATA